MINEIDSTSTGTINFEDFLKAVAYYKDKMENLNDDDMKNAFVSLGGEPDLSGDVDTDKLI